MSDVTPVRAAIDAAIRQSVTFATPVRFDLGSDEEVRRAAGRASWGEGHAISDANLHELLHPSTVAEVVWLKMQAYRLRRMIVVYAARPNRTTGPFEVYAAQLLFRQDLQDTVIAEDGSWATIDDTTLIEPELMATFEAGAEIPEFWVKLSPRTAHIPQTCKISNPVVYPFPDPGWQYAWIVSAVVYVTSIEKQRNDASQRLVIDLRNQLSADRKALAQRRDPEADLQLEALRSEVAEAHAALQHQTQRADQLSAMLSGGCDDSSQRDARDADVRESLRAKDARINELTAQVQREREDKARLERDLRQSRDQLARAPDPAAVREDIVRMQRQHQDALDGLRNTLRDMTEQARTAVRERETAVLDLQRAKLDRPAAVSLETQYKLDDAMVAIARLEGELEAARAGARDRPDPSASRVQTLTAERDRLAVEFDKQRRVADSLARDLDDAKDRVLTLQVELEAARTGARDRPDPSASRVQALTAERDRLAIDLDKHRRAAEALAHDLGGEKDHARALQGELDRASAAAAKNASAERDLRSAFAERDRLRDEVQHLRDQLARPAPAGQAVDDRFAALQAEFREYRARHRFSAPDDADAARGQADLVRRAELTRDDAPSPEVAAHRERFREYNARFSIDILDFEQFFRVLVHDETRALDRLELATSAAAASADATLTEQFALMRSALDMLGSFDDANECDWRDYPAVAHHIKLVHKAIIVTYGHSLGVPRASFRREERRLEVADAQQSGADRDIALIRALALQADSRGRGAWRGGRGGGRGRQARSRSRGRGGHRGGGRGADRSSSNEGRGREDRDAPQQRYIAAAAAQPAAQPQASYRPPSGGARGGRSW